MVQPDGNIKVMDFGIARAKNSHLTQDNSVLGTAHYVSPEQTQGKELGPTTDIYSLGIVMYEASTGQVPFQGDDAISVALKQVNEQPKPPSQLNPNVDPQLESIILKCMQKNPADRFQTADELHRTLRDYLAGRMQAVSSATAVVPVQVTNKLDRGATPMGGGTATMPRVDRPGRLRGQSATQLAAEEEAERQRRHRRNVILGTIGGIVAAVAVIVGIVMALSSGSAMKTVPNIINTPVDQAVEEIEAAGFVAGEPEYTYSDTVEKGRVCEQDPAGFREAPEGSTINFKVSNGPTPAEDVEVPNLSNLTQEEADKKLEDYGLIGRRGDDQESDEVEEGKVCAQDTEPGAIAKAGDTITFHISSGSAEVTVPSPYGVARDDYISQLEDLGLVSNVVTVSSNSVDAGYVIYTDPETGSSVEKGSTVNVYVSSGREEVSVPGVVGDSAANAKATLENLGFLVTVSGPADGIVVSQSVTGSAFYGAEITLTTEAAQTKPETPDTNQPGGSTDSPTNPGTPTTPTTPTGGESTQG